MQVLWSVLHAHLAQKGLWKEWRLAPGAALASTHHGWEAPNVSLAGRGRLLQSLGPQQSLTAFVRSITSCVRGEVAYPAQLDCIVFRVWGLHNSRVGFGLIQMFHAATSLSCVAEITWNALQDCWEDVRLGERDQLATTVRPAITPMAQYVSIAKREMCCRSFS